MAQRETLERLRNLRQMRLGQAIANFVQVPSLSDESGEAGKIALVPLSESEIADAMRVVGNTALPENIVGLELADRLYNQEVLIRAIRAPGNLEERVFFTREELGDVLSATDTNLLIEKLGEISIEAAGLEGLTDEELVELKKELEGITMSALSIRQQSVLKRSLLILKEPLAVSGVGSG